MYPKPTELFRGKGVSDDPATESYWKVANGIRLSREVKCLQETCLQETRVLGRALAEILRQEAYENFSQISAFTICSGNASARRRP